MRDLFLMKRDFLPRRGLVLLLLLLALAIGALAAGLSAETRTLRELHLAMRLREFAKSHACAPHCAARGSPDWRWASGMIGPAFRAPPSL